MATQTNPMLQRALATARIEYEAANPKSRDAWRVAQRSLPGGDTRSVVYHPPFPLAIAEGRGYRIRDLDGHEYWDFLNNYTALVHGHTHPYVVERVKAQLDKGTAFAAYVPAQHQLAETLVNRVPGLERVRFCNSGTEATLFAIQTARAYTGRSDIIKIEGGYHGGHDVVAVSVHPTQDAAGPTEKPQPVPESSGVDSRALAGVHVVPFNDAHSMERTLQSVAETTAAVILEPVLGQAGYIPPEPGYLQKVRELCTAYGVLLIFDEVQTLRLSVGGAQEIYQVVPDLTAMGKIIGGGFPVGAFGGKQEIMSLYDPHASHPLKHSGTFNGNPVTMVAGLAAMQLLDKKAIARLEGLGVRLQQGLSTALQTVSLAGHVTRAGSLVNLHFTPLVVRNYRDTWEEPVEVKWLLHLELLKRGIFTAPGRGAFNLSTVMDEHVVDDTIDRAADALQTVARVLSG